MNLNHFVNEYNSSLQRILCSLKGGRLMVNVKWIYTVVMIILCLVLAYLLVILLPTFRPIGKTVLTVLSPFIIAAFISYLLYPIIEKLAQMKVNKALAVSLIYVLFFATIGFILYRGIPLFLVQLQELGEQLPQLLVLYEDSIYSMYENTSFLPEVFHDKMAVVIQNIETKMATKLEQILEKLTNIMDFVLILTIIPVLVFYILIDYERIKQAVYHVLSFPLLIKTDKVLHAIDKSLGSYIRGQITISAFIMLITFLMYHTLQLKYGLLLAFIMGVMNIIPYFGPIIGTIPAILIAMTTSWKLVIIIIITNLLIQLVENSFLSPYIMGKSVQIHPIVIIFILIVGAEIGGIIGMIVAVPITTIAKAIIQQFYKINSNAIDI